MPVQHFLSPARKIPACLEAFREAGEVLLIFPLYTDCMPGIVKEFLERIYLELPRGGKKIGFMVQSGFREGIHSAAIERYLNRFAFRMGYESPGTLIKGGVEGIQIMPPLMTRTLFRDFRILGSYYAQKGEFEKKIFEKFRKPWRLSAMSRLMFRIISLTGMTHFYWNMNLKKNGAFDKKDDRPFLPATEDQMNL